MISGSASWRPASEAAFAVQFQIQSILDLVDAGSPLQFTVAVGTALTPPATFGALANVQTFNYTDMTTCQAVLGTTGTTLQLLFLCPRLTIAAAGLNAWLALFKGAAPAGTDAPLFVVGPVIVDAQ